MNLRRFAPLVALVLAVALAAGAVAGALRGPAQSKVRLGGRPVALTRTLSPAEPQFGDTVVATIDAFVDRARLDPGSVTLHASFAPYRVVSSRRSVRQRGGISIVHIVDRLDCLAPSCLGSGDPAVFRFPRLGVSYPAGAFSVAWPALRVHARVQTGDLLHPVLRVDPAQAHPSYRLPPHLTGWTLISVALVLALGGLTLVGRALLAALPLARGRRATPLELVLRELASANGDIGRRRSALERLARELVPLDEALSRESRLLAWAPQDPAPDAVSELLRRVGTVVRT